MNDKELNLVRFSSNDEEVKAIINTLVDLGRHSMFNSSDNKVKIERFSMEGNYSTESDKARRALLTYCAKKAGIDTLETKRDIVEAFEDIMFSKTYNSIIAKALNTIVLKSNPQEILKFANIETVDIGDSHTWEIEPKGLPIAQRISYTSNVVYVDGYSKTGITITPKPYAVGTSMDYIRIISGTYDIGAELAKVAMSLLMAQLKLIIAELYSTTPLTGTPMYQANFAATDYMQLISDITMLNGGAAVSAYGTILAFNAIGTIATTNYGFAAQDKMIEEGYLGKAYGINNIVVPQLTDLSEPFTEANQADLRFVPDDLIMLISSVADKPVKLVRENYVRVMVKDANAGAQYRYEYKYVMSFDAAVCTQAHYGIQKTTV